MSKNKGNTLLTVFAGIGAIAGVGVGAFYIMNSFNKTQHHYTYYNSEVKELEAGVKLTNNPIQSGKKDSEFFLSDKGVSKLKDKLNKCLQYGPELSEIKGIWIDDQNLLRGGEASGAYLPEYDKIVIGTGDWRKDGFGTVKETEMNDTQEDAKIELIFQVVFHEYGHFLANKYFNSDPNKSNDLKVYSFQSQDDDAKDPMWAFGNWSKDFLSRFKHLLSYDRNTINNKDGSYTASGLYQTLNTENAIKKVDGKYDDSASLYKKPTSWNNKAISNYDKYYYSIDELFTRKFQQILMPLIGETKGVTRFVSDSWFTMPSFSGYYHASPYGQDLLKYIDKDTKQEMMSDNPFRESGELYNLFGDYVGFNTHDSISEIYYHDKMIKVGGYTDDDDTKLLIDGQEYIDTSTHKMQVHLNTGINPKDAYVKYENKKVSNESKDYWVADDIPEDRIIGHELSLLIKGKVIPLNIKDPKFGTISTIRSLRDNDSSWKNVDYHVTKVNGVVKIEKGSGA